MDTRLKNLSYSSMLTLHSCPRKYQLYKLNSEAENNDTDGTQNLTFAYGHAVGNAIQYALQGMTEDEVIWRMFLEWHADLAEVDIKRNKSFYLAVCAAQKFLSLRANGFLKEYELLTYEGVPCCELGFLIEFPDSFKYRGFVDAVLRNKTTGEIIILECKTSSAFALNPAEYKNSAQAIGYSIVLDSIAPDISSYKVIYLVYNTKQFQYDSLQFTKTYLQRALWIQELLLDIESIKMYENAQVYPMRGESCYSWYRECEYLNLCTLSTVHLTKPMNAEIEQKLLEDESRYHIKLTLADLVNTQLNKANISLHEMGEMNHEHVS